MLLEPIKSWLFYSWALTDEILFNVRIVWFNLTVRFLFVLCVSVLGGWGCGGGGCSFVLFFIITNNLKYTAPDAPSPHHPITYIFLKPMNLKCQQGNLVMHSFSRAVFLMAITKKAEILNRNIHNSNSNCYREFKCPSKHMSFGVANMIFSDERPWIRATYNLPVCL